MRIAILADGRSAITRGWLESLKALGYETHLLTTFPCELDLPLASQHLIPIAFSGLRRRGAGSAGSAPGGAAAIQLRAAARRWLGMATFPGAIRRLRSTLEQIDVDLIHALRIPYEGMLAAATEPEKPLVLSVWGNDFTLHARSTPWMSWLTSRSLQRVQGLHTDCERDLRLAREWGLADGVPTFVAPGSGGLDRGIFRPGEEELTSLRPELRQYLQGVHPDAPVVINPRGFRAYVRNDTFFQAIPHILASNPRVKFLAPTMRGEKPAEQWITRLGIQDSVILLPHLTPHEMAALNRRSTIMISPSEHDGTPNTFLEAIACGCFPIVGDLESLREWIDDGANGLLIDPQDPEALAAAVVKALADEHMRTRAFDQNQKLVDERAERQQVGTKLAAFYGEVLSHSNPPKSMVSGAS